MAIIRHLLDKNHTPTNNAIYYNTQHYTKLHGACLRLPMAKVASAWLFVRGNAPASDRPIFRSFWPVTLVLGFANRRLTATNGCISATLSRKGCGVAQKPVGCAMGCCNLWLRRPRIHGRSSLMPNGISNRQKRDELRHRKRARAVAAAGLARGAKKPVAAIPIASKPRRALGGRSVAPLGRRDK
jgi:hypothetical protein